MMIMMMMSMVDNGDYDEDKDLFHNIDFTDDDLYGNLHVRFAILHNPIYMGI